MALSGLGNLPTLVLPERLSGYGVEPGSPHLLFKQIEACLRKRLLSIVGRQPGERILDHSPTHACSPGITFDRSASARSKSIALASIARVRGMTVSPMLIERAA